MLNNTLLGLSHLNSNRFRQVKSKCKLNLITKKIVFILVVLSLLQIRFIYLLIRVIFLFFLFMLMYFILDIERIKTTYSYWLFHDIRIGRKNPKTNTNTENWTKLTVFSWSLKIGHEYLVLWLGLRRQLWCRCRHLDNIGSSLKVWIPGGFNC